MRWFKRCAHNWRVIGKAGYVYRSGGCLLFICEACGAEGKRDLRSIAVLKGDEETLQIAALSIRGGQVKKIRD